MSGRSLSHTATAIRRPSFVAFLAWLMLSAPLIPATASAEIRIVNASGEYRLGDRDTREDAVRLATEAAKRNALEQVATYLESVTVVEGMDISQDEIRTYTAGLVLVLEQQTSTALEDDTIVVRAELLAQVDTEEVLQAIGALRENEDARHQLIALQQENERLLQDLEAANQALASASTADQVQQATQQRQDILNRVQSNAMVSQAWTDWVIVSPAVYPYPWVGLAQTQALLNVARGLYPTSPHVVAAQQVIASNQPPAPPQSPVSPVPGSVPHPTAGQPNEAHSGSQTPPRTLNEINHATPTAPPQIGNQPDTRALREARHVNPLNPMLPPGSAAQQSRAMTRMQQFLQQKNGGIGQPPAPIPGNQSTGIAEQQSRSMTRMQQFLQQNGGLRQPPGSIPGSQPPTARRLPPTINQIHPPMPHQVPRAPYQIAPRSPGGGGGFRGGGGGGGGGRGGGRGR